MKDNRKRALRAACTFACALLGSEAPALAWVNTLLERRPARLVSVALANKAARIAWVILTRGETYRAPMAAAA